MKKILIIGIGAGDPDYLTVQAINALNRADLFFLMDNDSRQRASSAWLIATPNSCGLQQGKLHIP